VGGVAVLLVVGVVLWRAGQDGIDTAATEDRSETDAEPADGGQAVADDVDEDDGAQGGEDEGAGVLDPTPELPPLDLQNAILPSNACSWVTEYLDLPDPLQLVDGEVPNLDMYAFIIVHPVQQPQMVDVDGDGTEEGLLPIQCNAGGSGTTDEVHVLAADGTPLDSFMVGDGVEGRPLLEQMSVEDGAITVLTHGTYPNEALCCGTLPVTEVHPFEDGRFGPVQRTTG
jgi:hypothetical protein